MLVTPTTRDRFALASTWAALVGSSDPGKALHAPTVTDWKAYCRGEPSTFRDQLARDVNGTTKGVIPYAFKHGGRDLVTGGSLASLASVTLPATAERIAGHVPLSAPRACVVCGASLASKRADADTCSRPCRNKRRDRKRSASLDMSSQALPRERNEATMPRSGMTTAGEPVAVDRGRAENALRLADGPEVDRRPFQSNPRVWGAKYPLGANDKP